MDEAYGSGNKKEIKSIKRKLRQLILERVSLVMQEHKRRLDMDNYVKVERIVVMLMGIAEIIKSTAIEEIEDRREAERVSARINDKIIALLPDGPKIVIEQKPDNDE